ncbi:MAG TPA: Uma2 family endonuclease [Oscillatoriaceae cyanobacterium M33_DOE_052]|uniref:Uma2 family endonuclease n=1 Tax=Planktothricoides sp. SpSt-374 TaxID=2282167 RepID=A0A7C3VTK6_9CYAN|nr:Uma2 family endonuclease [Oscillatoriaceae cyanobacterium M33_DOE_052]
MKNTIPLEESLELNIELTEEQYWQLCQNNRDLRFERTHRGELIIMPPTGGETGNRNSEITYQIHAWNRHSKLGKVFDSSVGFKLPNGSNRSPDASWVSQAKWDTLTPAQKTKFPPICPDFVIELRSPTDSLKTLQDKMQEYLENGAQLGWLIDPQTRTITIYRPQQNPETISNPTTVSGENILPQFTLDCQPIWSN